MMEVFVSFLLMASNAVSQPVNTADCTLVVFSEGASYEVFSSVTAAAHLKFPKDVQLVNLTNPQLWDETHHGRDVWIRGKTLEKLGSVSGNTIKLEDGTTINLVVKNRPESGLCYQFVPETAVRNALSVNNELQTEKAALKVATERAVEERQRYVSEGKKLQDIYTSALEKAQKQMALQANDAIEDFKQRIHTAYVVKATESPEFNVEAAYDDGLFTYIRIDNTAFGAPTVTKQKYGNSQIVEFSFNDITGVFTIPGLHNELAVHFEDTVISVKRVN